MIQKKVTREDVSQKFVFICKIDNVHNTQNDDDDDDDNY